MNLRLVRFLEQLHTSFWFVPGIMAIAAVAAAVGLLMLDALPPEVGSAPTLPWPMVSETDGARMVLSTIAGSVITVAGVIFSITIAVLIMASAQFGPRLIRNFMQHMGTQVVLGTLVATFVYCLIVLAAIRSGDQPFVPQRAIATGVLLGFLSVAALIYFIHHIAVYIQVPRIIDEVATRLEHALIAHFPERPPDATIPTPDDEQDGRGAPRDPPEKGRSAPILARHSGYVQAIDVGGLVRTARDHDLVVKLEVRAGHLVLAGRPVMQIRPDPRRDAHLAGRLLGAIIVGPERMSTQDPEFAVNQMVEIALRALSPGINDNFTAIDCIDRLGAALAVLATRDLPSRYHYDGTGRLRLTTNPITYHGIVDAAFDQIRQNARPHLDVMLRLIAVLHALGRAPLPEPFRHALRKQLGSIHALRDTLTTDCDRADFDGFHRRALEVLGE